MEKNIKEVGDLRVLISSLGVDFSCIFDLNEAILHEYELDSNELVNIKKNIARISTFQQRAFDAIEREQLAEAEAQFRFLDTFVCERINNIQKYFVLLKDRNTNVTTTREKLNALISFREALIILRDEIQKRLEA